MDVLRGFPLHRHELSSGLPAWDGLRRSILVLFAILILLSAGTTLLAGPTEGVRIFEPKEGLKLQPGSEITIRWTRLPEETREFELLLVDETSGERLRLTEEMEPDRCAYVWRVPNTPISTARLEIRLSRGAGEEFGARSGSFSISFAASMDLGGLAYYQGEWWTAPTWNSSFIPVVCHHSRLTKTEGDIWPHEVLDFQNQQSFPIPTQPGRDRSRIIETVTGVTSAALEFAGRQPTSIPQRE